MHFLKKQFLAGETYRFRNRIRRCFIREHIDLMALNISSVVIVVFFWITS